MRCLLLVLSLCALLSGGQTLLVPAASAEEPSRRAQVAGVSTRELVQRRNLRFAQLSSAEGLSQDSVMAIVQDHQGFIWIGTQEGLNRYDGHQIKVFERDPLDSNSLSNNWIFALMVANDGRLWVATDGGGLNIYDPLTEKFATIMHDASDAESISSNRIRALAQDRTGDIWVGTVKSGLNRIRTDGSVVRYRTTAEDSTSIPHDSILRIYEDKQGRVWVGTDGGGLARYDRASDSFVRYVPDTGAHGLRGKRVTAVQEDRDGWLWVGTRDAGLNRLDMTTGKFENFQHDDENPESLSNNFVRDVLEDRDGTLWVSTDDGLNEWLPARKGFAHYFSHTNDPTSLAENRLANLFQSSDGVLWIGSYRGVSTWNYLSDAFVHYRKDDGALGADIVTSIAEAPDGVLWIGTYGAGLAAIDRLGGEVTFLRHDPEDINSLSEDRVMAVFVDAQGTVWAGTRRDGLNRIDIARGTVTRFQKPQLSSNSITVIHGDPDGSVWVGTFGGGLNRIRPDGSISVFIHDEDDATSIGDDRVLSLMRDKDQVLWVGTEQGGLNRFNDDDETFTRFLRDPANPNSLSSNAAWEVFESSDGSLWIATMNDGLNQWRSEERRAQRAEFRKWTKADGLRSNATFGLLEDDDGSLWVSSNRGLSRIDLARGEMRHYDRHNGLIGDEFNHGARARSRSGHLLFGGSEGLLVFDPGQVRRSQTMPPIVVSAFSPIERLAVRYSVTPSDEPAQLQHTDNYVAFVFAALDYTSPDKNDFRYKLEGFDSDWQDPGDMRRITYANLSPGRYLFRVKAANNDGVWNEQGASIAILVLPPPWRTVWAYAGYAIVAGIIGLLLVNRVQVRRAFEARRREELERQVRERTSELGDRNRQLEKLNDRLLKASFTDSLTGLYNRRYLDQFIEQQVGIVDRESHDKRGLGNADYQHYQQTVLFFMMIDLDGFKVINDNFGHAAGDRALLQVRDELIECTRQSDTVIRWGGDEFLIVGRTRGLSGIANFAERVRFAISERVYDVGDGATGTLSCSIGAVPYPFAPLKTELLSWEQSLNLADAGAYVVKANGRNGWFVVSGTPQISREESARLPQALDTLVDQGKVTVGTSLRSPYQMVNRHQTVA